MMKAHRLPWPVLLVTVLSACAQRGDHPHGVGRAILPDQRGTASAVRAEVSKSAARLRVHWTFTNPEKQPVWFPVTWDQDYLPYAFLVPPNDLMLAFGDMKLDPHGRGAWIEVGHADPTRYVQLPPGSSVEGTVELALPYDPQLQRMGSPYERQAKGGLAAMESPRPTRQVQALQLAVQYWLHDPEKARDGEFDQAADEAYRLSVATGVIEGEKRLWPDKDAFVRVVLGPRIAVQVPLAKECELYYYPRLEPAAEETDGSPSSTETTRP